MTIAQHTPASAFARGSCCDSCCCCLLKCMHCELFMLVCTSAPRTPHLYWCNCCVHSTAIAMHRVACLQKLSLVPLSFFSFCCCLRPGLAVSCFCWCAPVYQIPCLRSLPIWCTTCVHRTCSVSLTDNQGVLLAKAAADALNGN